MANSVSTQILLDGPRNTVVKFEGVLDTSDLASTVIVDPATLVGIDNTGNRKAAKFRIDDIQFNVEDGLSLNLFWDATTPVRVEELTGRGHMKYHTFGGLVSNAGAGVTGKITATTQGWVAAQILSFSLVMKLVKTQ